MSKGNSEANNLRIRGGADYNGVWYQFFQDFGALKIDSPLYKVTVDSIGQMHCEKCHKKEMQMLIESEIDKYASKVFFVLPLISVFFALIALIFIAKQIMKYLFMIAIWPLACMYIYKAIGIFIAINKEKDVNEFAGFLGAHNVVESAYKKLSRIPTLEEVKRFSCYAENTEYLKNADKACFFFLVSFMLILSVKEYMIVWVIISLLLTIFFKKLNVLSKLLSKLVVKQPTNLQLEVAISALEGAEKEIMRIQLFVTEKGEAFFVCCQNNCSDCEVAEICPQNHDRLSC